MRSIIAIAAAVLVLATQMPAQAREPFDGLWAKTRKDCRNKEGPDSKTFIDLDNVIRGKPAPLVDQYENHCRIDHTTKTGNGMVLAATCFEFWGNYTKGVEGRKATIRLVPRGNGRLMIDDKSYRRCNSRNALKAR